MKMGWFMKEVEKQLKERCDGLEKKIITLRNEKDSVEDALYTLQCDHEKMSRLHKIQEEEIAHKIKMRDEQVNMEKDKGIAEAAVTADRRVTEVKDQYQNKLTTQLEERGDELRSMYKEILEKLPDVNVEIGGGATVKTKKKR
jgi:predicted  nucleic acid-binding Zn-ribbon protein